MLSTELCEKRRETTDFICTATESRIVRGGRDATANLCADRRLS